MSINLGALDILLGCIGRKLALGELRDTIECLGVRVVVVVNGNDLVLPGLLQNIDDVRACMSTANVNTVSSSNAKQVLPM